MFGEDYRLSDKAKNRTKTFVEAAIANYNESLVEAPKNGPLYSADALAVVEATMARDQRIARYQSFSETIRNAFVVEGIYDIFKECVKPDIKADTANTSIMRAMVNQYVTENGYGDILARMKVASPIMSEMASNIDKTVKAVLETVDKKDTSTFVITPEMKDEFFKSLDYSNTEAIEDAIRTRVSTALQDFVTANTKDHEDITAALKDAEEKIADVPENEVELREYYEMKGKRAVNEIRSRPKSVYHSMVTAMCESVMKHPEYQGEFMVEGHLDMDKITTRTYLMYTFMEMLNTARIDTINEAYIHDMLKNLSE